MKFQLKFNSSDKCFDNCSPHLGHSEREIFHINIHVNISLITNFQKVIQVYWNRNILHPGIEISGIMFVWRKWIRYKLSGDFNDEFSITLEDGILVLLLFYHHLILPIFAHAITARLSYEMKNFVIIMPLKFGWNQNCISIEFDKMRELPFKMGASLRFNDENPVSWAHKKIKPLCQRVRLVKQDCLYVVLHIPYVLKLYLFTNLWRTNVAQLPNTHFSTKLICLHNMNK